MTDASRNEALAADLRTKSDAEFRNILALHEAARIIRGVVKDSGEDPFFIMIALDSAINTDEESFENAGNLFDVEKARRDEATLAVDQAPSEDAAAA